MLRTYIRVVTGACYLVEGSGLVMCSATLSVGCTTLPLHFAIVCTGSVVATAHDSESGCPGSNPQWGLIYYEAPITAQGLPEPSSFRDSTLGTRAAEHKGCNWACKLTDGCSLKTVFGHTFWHMPRKKVNLTACSASVTGFRGAQLLCRTFTFIFSIICLICHRNESQFNCTTRYGDGLAMR